jgi:signal transduction histidine kinase
MGVDEVDLKDLRQFMPGRTSKKNRGTGFGLPIAEKNVRAHGGQLSLESQRDRGTTVTMVLPIEQQKGDEP